MTSHITERRARKAGNSIVITLPKEFLAETGIKENDMLYIDIEKLKSAVVKKEISSERQKRIEMLANQSLAKYEEGYRRLVEK